MPPVKYLAKVLEVIIDGTREGTIHLDLNGNLKVARTKLSKIENKITIKNLLNTNTDILFDYQQYIKTIEKGIQSDFPNSRVEIKERKIGKYWEQRYGKSLAKRY